MAKHYDKQFKNSPIALNRSVVNTSSYMNLLSLLSKAIAFFRKWVYHTYDNLINGSSHYGLRGRCDLRPRT